MPLFLVWVGFWSELASAFLNNKCLASSLKTRFWSDSVAHHKARTRRLPVISRIHLFKNVNSAVYSTHPLAYSLKPLQIELSNLPKLNSDGTPNKWAYHTSLIKWPNQNSEVSLLYSLHAGRIWRGPINSWQNGLASPSERSTSSKESASTSPGNRSSSDGMSDVDFTNAGEFNNL